MCWHGFSLKKHLKTLLKKPYALFSPPKTMGVVGEFSRTHDDKNNAWRTVERATKTLHNNVHSSYSVNTISIYNMYTVYHVYKAYSVYNEHTVYTVDTLCTRYIQRTMWEVYTLFTAHTTCTMHAVYTLTHCLHCIRRSNAARSAAGYVFSLFLSFPLYLYICIHICIYTD